MRVRISRIDPTLPLPRYATAGAVAFDLAPRVDVTIPAGGTAFVPANIVLAVPEGHALLIAPRSSLHKRGIVLANQMGVIDQDYCGPGDEVGMMLRNVTDAPITVQRSERLCQGLVVPIARVEWEEQPLTAVTAATRGGFGSTGTH